MTSSETSSQQQQQLSSSMHLQCVQGCLLVHHSQHHSHHHHQTHSHLHPDKLSAASSASTANCLSSFACPPNNNLHHPTFSTAQQANSTVSGASSPNSILINNNNNTIDTSSISTASHADSPIINNNSSKVAAIVSSSALSQHQQQHHYHHNHHHLLNSTNHNNNDETGSVTSSLLSVSSSPSSSSVTSSAYLSCCSNLSLNGQSGGSSGLKISDNHLSTKLLRNSSAPYTINNNSPTIARKSLSPNSASVGDELGAPTGTRKSIMGSTTVNGVGVGVICGVNGISATSAGNMVKLEPNGNSIEINSVDNQLHLSPSAMHLQNGGAGGASGPAAGCCHHGVALGGPMNQFGVGGMGGIPTTTVTPPTPNGLMENNCDLDNCNIGNNNGEMNNEVVPMDTSNRSGGPTNTFGCHSHNGNQCNHGSSSGGAAPNNSNTLVSSSPLMSSCSAGSTGGMTMSSCNSGNSNSNGNGVGLANINNAIAIINGGANGPSVGNNMSPGENDDEHDCDDDKVINGDTFGAAGELPDPDSIKMFVGQIPKHMNETDLKELFEKYGRVYQINVLRDKATKQSKGCCFVTFFTRKAALDAQNALHNVKTLPGMNNTVQMKPADNENRYDRKLFIGMISKKLNETDVRNMFSRFGTIDDCTVLRLPNGESRGCAFTTFSTKQSAQNAIKAVHQSITMEGCSSPIVVKFADTPKDKDQKRQSQMVTTPGNLLSTLSTTAINPVQQQYYSAILHHQLQQQQQPQQGGFFSQLSPLGVQGITGIGGLGSTSATGIPGLGSAHLSTTNAADLATLTGLLSGVTQNPHSLTVQTLAALGNSSLSPTGASGNTVGSGNSVASLTGNGLQSGLTSYHVHRTAAVNAKQQAEGPEGCNLFIYHLPPECGDAELAQMFISFGTVLSAKVFIDKQTNLSKCFGFVSFDNQLSAQMAISAMNGFQVGVKRLKVQLKRSKSKDAAKPY